MNHSSITSQEFGRREVKYLIDRTRRTGLERDLAALMRPDPYANGDGTYRIRSLYFDSPDYMAYHQKMAGGAVRHKIRMRAYGDDPMQATKVRLEVKSRYLSYNHKTLVDIPREQYLELEDALLRHTLPRGILENSTVPKEFFRLQRQYNMEPKVIVEYRRRALERRELGRTRVNFDDDLTAGRSQRLFEPMRAERRLLWPGNSIFEIKVDGKMPTWLHQLISKYELQDQAISKYCFGVRSEALLSGVARGEDYVYQPGLAPELAWPYPQTAS